MKDMLMRQVIALFGCLCLVLQGCAVMQAVPVPQGGSTTAAVQVGDTVEATTRSGEVKRFKVTAVTNEELGGADARVTYSEIASLEVARHDARTRTVWWILGGAALAALLAGASGGGGSSY